MLIERNCVLSGVLTFTDLVNYADFCRRVAFNWNEVFCRVAYGRTICTGRSFGHCIERPALVQAQFPVFSAGSVNCTDVGFRKSCRG